MFSRRKNSQNDVVSLTEQRLHQLAGICGAPNQDINITVICQRFIAFKKEYKGSYAEYLITIENAISAAIHDFASGPFLDIIVLKRSLEKILFEYQKERDGERTLKNSSIVEFLASLIEDINGAIPLPRYSQYEPHHIQRYQKSILAVVGENPAQKEPFLFSVARIFNGCCDENYPEINNSLVTRKLMFSIGEKIDSTLKKIQENDEYKGYTLDLFRSLGVILSDYQSIYESNHKAPFDGYGRCYRMIREYVSALNKAVIDPERLQIIQSFVNDLNQPETNLKRIAKNFLLHFPNSGVYSNLDQQWIAKIREVISDSINRFNFGKDIYYFQERSLIDSLKKILFSEESSPNVKNFVNDNINIPAPDPLYYKDYFDREYKVNLTLQNQHAFKADFHRHGSSTVMSGKRLNQDILKCERGVPPLFDHYPSIVEENLFSDASYSLDFKAALYELFCRHTNQRSLSHLSRHWPMSYLGRETKDSKAPDVCFDQVNDHWPVLFYPIKNGYGIVQKNGLKMEKNTENLSESQFTELMSEREEKSFPYYGIISMGYELTLDSENPNPDDITVRCTGLKCEIVKTQDDEKMNQVLDQLFEKIQEKSVLIFPWQRVDVEVSLFAYDVAIKPEDNRTGHRLQEITKAFCAAVRENYSSPTPNTTRIDEMNRLTLSIKEVILAYQKNALDPEAIDRLDQQVDALRQSFQTRSSGHSPSMFSSPSAEPPPSLKKPVSTFEIGT